MKRLIALIILGVAFSSVQGMVRTGVEVSTVEQPGDDIIIQETWVGPGWYYGYWFDNQPAFIAWNTRYGYVAPVVWTGPGWYYGIWFGSNIEFNNWHYHHHYDHHRRHDHSRRHHDGRGGGGSRHKKTKSQSKRSGGKQSKARHHGSGRK